MGRGKNGIGNENPGPLYCSHSSLSSDPTLMRLTICCDSILDRRGSSVTQLDSQGEAESSLLWNCPGRLAHELFSLARLGFAAHLLHFFTGVPEVFTYRALRLMDGRVLAGGGGGGGGSEEWVLE